jgi:hypothetical protein
LQKPVSAIDFFDEDFYLKHYPEIVESGLGAYDYYMAIGWVQGHDPSPDFSTSEYLKAHTDVAKANINPLQHYIERGIGEGRTISASVHAAKPVLYRDEIGRASYDKAYGEIFDEVFYLANYPDAADGNGRPLEHYLSIGWLKDYDPSPEFSTADYLAANPDVARAGINPLKHYIENGRAEGRLLKPAPIDASSQEIPAARYNPEDYAGVFDEDFYLDMYPEVSDSGLEPLVHYMEIGWKGGYDPGLTFSTESYLQDHPDIARANLNPLEHYVSFGRGEGRRIQPSKLPKGVPEVVERYQRAQVLEAGVVYFDAEYYRHTCPDCPSDDGLAFEHYLEVGWRKGYDPSADFSIEAYLQDYPDVAKSGLNPLIDYVRFGKAAGRRFRPRSLLEQFSGLGYDEADLRILAESFDADFYRREYATDLKGGVEPFRHYLTKGFRTNDPSSDFSTAYYYEANPDIAATNLNPFLHYLRHGRAEGRASAGRATKQYIHDQLRLLLKAEETPRRKGQKSAKSKTPDFERVLLSSHLFDVRYVAEQLELENDAPSVVRAYLRLPEAGRPNGNALFDKAFYLRTYGAEVAEGSDPFLHFVLTGAKLFRYPGNDVLQRDVHIVKSMGRFDEAFYQAALDEVGEAGAVPSLLEHYLLHGQKLGLDPNKDFDTGLYSLLAQGEITGACSPYVHYLLNAHKNYVYGNAVEIATAALALRSMAIFNAETYRKRYGLGADIDPALHYLILGVRQGAVISDEFDTEYYLSQYPDMLEAPINPLIHYVRHGKAEGRTGAGNAVSLDAGGQDFDPDRETVLVVSHEASLTGAPIVALNVVREFAKTRNVICWLGKGGRLLPDFVEAGVAYVVGFGGRRSASKLVAAMIETYALRFAYVNSIVSHSVIEPLLGHMVPTTLMIHEFANYVYPKGVVTRSVLLADKTVFPARIVQASAVDEGRELKISRFPETVITPQGHNGLAESLVLESEFAELMALLHIEDRAKTKVMFGAGSVGIRKGVDLFIQTADYLNRRDRGDWRFIWVGGGYAPKTDMGYSVYLKDQVALSGLADKFFFVPEQRNLDLFWEIADVFFMSSRLDPYPNVALDALNKRVPLVCFEGATGVADLADRFPFAVHRVPYLDTAAAAVAVEEIVDNQVAIREAFAECHSEMLHTFSFAHYVDLLRTYEADALAMKVQVGKLNDVLAARSVGERRDLVSDLPRFLFSNVVLNETQGTSIIAKALATDTFSSFYSVGKDEPIRRRSISYFNRPPLPGVRDDVVLPEAEVALVAWLDDEVDAAAAIESMKLFDAHRILLGGPQAAKVKPALDADKHIRVVDASDLIRFIKAAVSEAGTEFICNVSDFLVEKPTVAACIHSTRLLFPLSLTFAKAAQALSAAGDAAVLMPRRLYKGSTGEQGEEVYRTRFSIMARTESLSDFVNGGRLLGLTGDTAELVEALEDAFEQYCTEARQILYRHGQF